MKDKGEYDVTAIWVDARGAIWHLNGADMVPIIAERREAAGKIGDENAPQTQRPEIDTRGLSDVQTT